MGGHVVRMGDDKYIQYFDYKTRREKTTQKTLA